MPDHFRCENCGVENSEFNTTCRHCKANLSESKIHSDSTGSVSKTTQKPQGDEPARPTVDWSGRTVSQYQIQDRIGAGGMGVVYRAVDSRLGRTVAIKVLPVSAAEGDTSRLRFLQEARLASRLDHPNLGNLYEAEEHEGQLFLVMAFHDGQTLAQRIAQGPVSIEEATEILTQVTEGLAAMHRASIVHRDIKPSNVMVTRSGQVKLLDLGLAKLRSVDEADPGLTDSHRIVGTTAYMSPEQARGEDVDPRSDLWSLGVVAYEVLTGERPFRGRNAVAVVQQVLNHQPQPLTQLRPEIPQPLQELVFQLLRKDPEERPPSAEEVLLVLRQATSGRSNPRADTGSRPWAAQQAGSSAVTRVVRPQVPARRKRVVLGILALLAILTAVYGGWKLTNRGVAPLLPGSEARPLVAVLSLENRSGNQETAWLSTAFAEMLSTELAAGDKLRTSPGEEVARALQELALKDTSSFGQETLVRLRNNLGADLIIAGSFTALGSGPDSQIRLDLRLQDTASGQTLASLAESGSGAQMFELVSRVGARLRQKLDLAPRDLSDAGQVQAALPRNREAARLYTEGLEKLRNLECERAQVLLEQVIAREAGHALAHSALAKALECTSQDQQAAREARKAVELSTGLAQREQLLLEAQFHENNGEGAKAMGIYRSLWKLYPDEIEYGLRLLVVTINSDQPKEARVVLQELRRHPLPDNLESRMLLHEASIATLEGNHREAQKLAARSAERADALNLANLAALARRSESWSYFNLGDYERAKVLAEASRQIFASRGMWWGEAQALNTLSVVLHFQGDLRASLQAIEQAVVLCLQAGEKNNRAIYETNAVSSLIKLGPLNEARARGEQVLALAREIDRKDAIWALLVDLSQIAVAQGRLEEARLMLDEALAMSRSAQAARDEAWILFHQGRLAWKRGDLKRARKDLEQSLQMRQDRGFKYFAAESQAGLARVLLDQGQVPESEALARQAWQTFEQGGLRDDAALAEATLALTFLAQGKTREAQQAIQHALQTSLSSQALATRLEVQLVAGQIQAGLGVAEAATATEALEAVLTEAAKAGLYDLQLEVRLALGRFEISTGRTEAGRARLHQLPQEARERGFGLVALKADALLDSEFSPTHSASPAVLH